MSGELFDSTLKQYALSIGMSELKIHEDHQVFLTFSPGIKVDLQWLVESNQLQIFSVVSRFSQNQSSMLVELMSANYFWSGTSGATLSLDKATNHIFLADKWPSDVLKTIDQLSRKINAFVDSVEHWRSFIENFEEKNTGSLIEPNEINQYQSNIIWG